MESSRRGSPKISKQEPRPTPSEYLAKNLRNAGHALGLGEQSAQAIDLSEVNISKALSQAAFRRRRGPRKTYGRPQRQSLQTTLGEYIRLVDPFLSSTATSDDVNDLDTALGEVFRADSQRYLVERGYDVEDVVAWAWILKSKDPHQAVSRMFALEANYRTMVCANSPGVPQFIPLFLMKERYLDAQTFRLLLIYSLHLMSGRPLPSFDNFARGQEDYGEPPPGDFHPKVDSTTCMIMVVRLIRHARQVWPHALRTIARAFAHFLTTPTAAETENPALSKHKADRFRTEKFNDCLWLLSLPSNVHPFRSASIQQQAQFELLRAMATHTPVLPLTRKGYQAVVAVQAAHKKTTAERQSTELKAPSWPPWKEERLGIDAQRGNEGMFSRAMNVLSQMKEAGYSHQLWEEISSILAGWDTDRSPTVQIRTLLHRPRPLSRAWDNDPNHYAIWAARIRATRTVREAWACFLSYQDHGLPPKTAIYASMAEKLIYRQKAVKSGFEEISHALPGDGPEVHSEPASARDIIYVHTEPPTLEEFLDKMLKQGIQPSGRFLGLLLQSAPTFRSGLQYLQGSNLTDDQITALCTAWYCPTAHATRDKERVLKALQALPDFLFASFIQFLCSHSRVISQHTNRDTLSPEHFPVLVGDGQPPGSMTDLFDFQEELGQSCHPKAMWHAVQLAQLRQPTCHGAWTHMLIALSGGRLSKRHPPRTRDLYRVLAWHEAIAVLDLMKYRRVGPDMKGFHFLCLALSRAFNAGMRHIGLTEEAFRLVQEATHHGGPIEPDGRDDFDALVETGLELLKSQFDNLVLPTSKTSELAERSVFVADSMVSSELQLPTVLHVPSFAVLHSFVRVLGLVGDGDGLLHLLQWMSRSAAPLSEVADEQLNGAKQMRLTLTATRVFLEKLQARSFDGARITSDPKVEEAYDIISRTPGWEWPSDAEVEEYLR